ncbi:MAG: hypothetical protein K2H72_07635, partial [Muribaculaceae bacterium]|nr:hypothetical protein [Muribaculaceae bacterium]
VRMHGLEEFSGLALRLWIVDMLLEGLKTSTVKRYYGALHTFYKEWITSEGIQGEDTLFSLSISEFH